MTKRQQSHIVPYTADQMFDLVADVGRYPEFVPYCTALRILRQTGDAAIDEITAQMVVQYKVFREQFKCKVNLNRPENKIDVTYLEGPIRKLNNSWRFEDLPEGGSNVNFSIDFEFKNFVMQRLSNAVFDKAFTYMSDAFVTRAHDVYGEPVGGNKQQDTAIS